MLLLGYKPGKEVSKLYTQAGALSRLHSASVNNETSSLPSHGALEIWGEQLPFALSSNSVAAGAAQHGNQKGLQKAKG